MSYLQTGKRRRNLVIAVIAALFFTILILFIQVTEITVTGNERYTDQQIIDLVFPGKHDRNTAYCYLKDRLRPHDQIPFVEDFEIVFNSLNQVEIIVYEKNVVGYVAYMSSYMYFDKDGIIVESTNSRVAGIPWVTGLKFGQIVLYQPLPVESNEIFREILNLTQTLSIYQIQVDKIQYNSYGEAILYLDELEIVMGSSEGLNGKIAELNDMLPQLYGRAGTLFLDTYKDMDTNTSFTFKPR